MLVVWKFCSGKYKNTIIFISQAKQLGNGEWSQIYICDPVCEKGAYSLSKLSDLTKHNS